MSIAAHPAVAAAAAAAAIEDVAAWTTADWEAWDWDRDADDNQQLWLHLEPLIDQTIATTGGIEALHPAVRAFCWPIGQSSNQLACAAAVVLAVHQFTVEVDVHGDQLEACIRFFERMQAAHASSVADHVNFQDVDVEEWVFCGMLSLWDDIDQLPGDDNVLSSEGSRAQLLAQVRQRLGDPTIARALERLFDERPVVA